MAYTTVANTPGTLPRPSSMSTGMRYTKLGIVCMVSRMGRTKDSNRLLSTSPR